ncbi:MAG: hypothetical protein ACFB0C_02100 [Leptolyngbyaceae cyanobacterium]
MADIELPVADLPNRYSVARSQVYARLDALKQRSPALIPEKRGKKAYVSGDLLEALDSMHVLIKQGETVAEAADKVLNLGPQTRSISPAGQTDRTQDSSPIFPVSDRISDLALLAGAISANQPPPDPLTRYRQLEEIVANGWLLPTSELAALLDASNLSGQTFERYGFKFTRAGKAGSESTWRVEKVS